MMKGLAKYMSMEKLEYFASGIFYSTLSYCLPFLGNVFGLDTYKEQETDLCFEFKFGLRSWVLKVKSV